MKFLIITTFALAASFLAAPLPALAAAKGQPQAIPDFTKGDMIPAGAKHDWNLGVIGARGWMFCDKMVTSDAPQIPEGAWASDKECLSVPRRIARSLKS